MNRAGPNAVAAASGALFALGLALGGMTQPSKVRGFLDFSSRWDPSLLFVMAGAVTVYFVAYRLVLRGKRPVFDKKFHLPTRRAIDLRLVVGAVIFGIGWGLAGYCPGPALVSLGSGALAPALFVLAMLAGMWLEHNFDVLRARRASDRPATVSDIARNPS